MTPPKYEIHETTCPRLCKFVWTGACHHHESHACTCPGASYVAVDRKELEELVEAAEAALEAKYGQFFGMYPEGKKLNSALQPFRRSEP